MNQYYGAIEMPVEWQEVDGIIKKLIKEVKEHQTAHLEQATFTILFRSEPKKERGKPALASVKKCSPLETYLMQTDYLLEIWLDAWHGLQPNQKLAVIDHELCHCYMEIDDQTGEYDPTLEPHDLQEFRGVVARHGLCLDDVRKFVETALSSESVQRQMQIPLFVIDSKKAS